MAARQGKRFAALLVLMAVALAAGLLVGRTPPAGTGWGGASAEVRAVMWPEPLPLAHVSLETQHGRPFTPADLRGHWGLMFFGYLRCPDVCPTGLAAMREMRRLLDEQGHGGGERYYFVSVDPEHDTPQQMAAYLAGFDPDFVGLHGPQPEIRRLADSMAVRFESIVDNNGHESIDHTSSVMMIDPSGRMVGALPPPLVPRKMARHYLGLRKHLENTP